jgi:L-seryl-tRNA(Ser) seleniumtransferase
MSTVKRSSKAVSRREVFQAGSFLAAAGLMAPGASGAAARLPMRAKGPSVYQRVGIEPFINLTSTRTINGGAAQLPEVSDAIHEASFYHVNLEELLQKVSPRIAELLEVPGAFIGSGAAGCLTSATLACMCGGDVEALQQLPNTDGLNDEVVAFRETSSIYDHAIRMTGAQMVNVATVADLKKAFGPRTCMAFAGAAIQDEKSNITLEAFAKAAHEHGVPLLIDAANELPQKPDPLLSRGADLVVYSGGKSLKGPQSAGLMLGRKDLTEIAFWSSAPHHTFARPMKVSKEEVIGALVAVEYLVTKRNLEEEHNQFKFWYRHIADRITQVPGVTAEITDAPRPGYYPEMKVEWDQDQIGYVAREIGEQLLNGEPRIMSPAYPKELDPKMAEGNNFLIRPMAMWPEDYKVVAERLHEIFKNAPGKKTPRRPAPPAGSLDGHWEVDVAYTGKTVRHTMYLQNKGNEISGLHRGRISQGKVKGEIDGDKVDFESRGKYEAADMRYFFRGTLRGDQMRGELGLGEYGKATWKARRTG